MRRPFDDLRDSVQTIATAHFTHTTEQKRLTQRLLGGEYSPKKLQPGVVFQPIPDSKKRFIPAPQNFFDLALILDDTVVEDIFSARVDNKGKLTGDEFNPLDDPIFERLNRPQGGGALLPLEYVFTDRLNTPSLFQEIFFELDVDERKTLKSRYTPARINAMLDHCPDADAAIELVRYLGIVFDVRRTEGAGAELLTLLLQTALYEVLDFTERAQSIQPEPNEQAIKDGVKAILSADGRNNTVPGIWRGDLGEMPHNWHLRAHRFHGCQDSALLRLNVHGYTGFIDGAGFPRNFTPTHLVNGLLPALADYNCDGGVFSKSKPLTKHACFVARAIASGRLSLLAFDNPFYDIAAQYLEDLNTYHVVDAREIALGRLIVRYMNAVIESGDKKNKWGGFYDEFSPEMPALFRDLSLRHVDVHENLRETFASSGLDLSQLKKAGDFINTVWFLVGLHANDAQAVYQFLWQHGFAERGREMARNYFPNPIDPSLTENQQRSADVKALMGYFGFDDGVIRVLSDDFIDPKNKKGKKKKKKKAKRPAASNEVTATATTTAGTQTSPLRRRRGSGGEGTSGFAELVTPTATAPVLSRDAFVDASIIAKEPLQAVDAGDSLSGGILPGFVNELLISLSSDFHLVYETEKTFLVIPDKVGSSSGSHDEAPEEREAYRYAFNPGGESEPEAVNVSFSPEALNAMPHAYYKQDADGQTKASTFGAPDTAPADYLLSLSRDRGGDYHPVQVVDSAAGAAFSDSSSQGSDGDADDYDVSRLSAMPYPEFAVIENACRQNGAAFMGADVPQLLGFMNKAGVDQVYFSSPRKGCVVMTVVDDDGADFFEYEQAHSTSEIATARRDDEAVDASRAVLVRETERFLVVRREGDGGVELDRVGAADFNNLLPKLERPDTENPVLNLVFDITELADRFKRDDVADALMALCNGILAVNPGGLGAEPVDDFYADFTTVETPDGATVRTPVRTPVQTTPGAQRMGTPGPSTPQRLLTPGPAMLSPRTPVMKLRDAKIRTPGTGEVVHHDWVDLQNLAFLENAATQIVHFLNENLVVLASGHEVNEDFYNALFMADDDEIPLLQKLLAMVDTRANVLEGLRESFFELGATEAPIVTLLRAISTSSDVTLVQKRKNLQCVTMYAYWLCGEDAAQLLEYLPVAFENLVGELYAGDEAAPQTAGSFLDNKFQAKHFLRTVMAFDLTPRAHADDRAGTSSSAGPVELAGNSFGTFGRPGSANPSESGGSGDEDDAGDHLDASGDGRDTAAAPAGGDGHDKTTGQGWLLEGMPF